MQLFQYRTLIPTINPTRSFFLAALLQVALLVDAHEGHRPLPTRGMEVNVETGTMVLTKAARETLVPYAQAKGLYTDEDIFRFLENCSDCLLTETENCQFSRLEDCESFSIVH